MDFCNGNREYYLVMFTNSGLVWWSRNKDDYGMRYEKIYNYCKPYCKMNDPIRTKNREWWHRFLGFDVKNKEIIEDIIFNSAYKWQLITKDNYRDVLEFPITKDL